MEKLVLSGCVIIKNNSILLLHRIKRNWYELPGGKIMPKELPEEAAVRELKEELRCDVKIVKKIGQKDFEENGFLMTYHWFLAKIINGTPQVGEPHTFDGLDYIPLNRLEDYALSPNMQNLAIAIKKGLNI